MRTVTKVLKCQILFGTSVGRKGTSKTLLCVWAIFSCHRCAYQPQDHCSKVHDVLWRGVDMQTISEFVVHRAEHCLHQRSVCWECMTHQDGDKTARRYSQQAVPHRCQSCQKTVESAVIWNEEYVLNLVFSCLMIARLPRNTLDTISWTSETLTSGAKRDTKSDLVGGSHGTVFTLVAAFFPVVCAAMVPLHAQRQWP